ncbi:glycosyltransferase family 4 protein [Gloeothece verrucosa]|uniref:Glycosyl transferase group 1 n=1 Tax=Gloeothece verrucosa (strain PCC 7822) TaxID=497965 RepID=E0UCG7_GLOV7|nr:glycosyltransferase family 4 protein [Gloeothece verrucosa]ADN14038.1 glycosyl transferase group 1 [Gloeothece verrucosa PCC 7822]
MVSNLLGFYQGNNSSQMRVLIVAENVSLSMGGESSLPLYYFQLLRSRNIETWLICHERVEAELRESFSPEELHYCYFIKDNPFQKMFWETGLWFPYRIQDLIFGQFIHFFTQQKTRLLAKQIIHERNIQLVFEPSPITPKGISFMYDMGVPVVIGPLCGGLNFPPAFQFMDSKFSGFTIKLGRYLALICHKFIPGKLQAAALIVANQRTAKALPVGVRGKIYEVIESGINLSVLQLKNEDTTLQERGKKSVRFVYSGRFVDWKGIQFIVKAFEQVAPKTDAILELVGDGQLRPEIEAKVKELNLEQRIIFHGWLTQAESIKIVRNCDVFVMPSLRECGGTALLEAMALGIPVITTKWAGPADYVTPECGILVEPSSIQTFIDGLAQAMLRLAQSPELRDQMGKAGTERVKTNYYDWVAKTDRIIEIFQEVLQDGNREQEMPVPLAGSLSVITTGTQTVAGNPGGQEARGKR